MRTLLYKIRSYFRKKTLKIYDSGTVGAGKYIAVPVGVIITQFMQYHDISKAELEKELQITTEELECLLNGILKLNNNIVEKLTEVFGLSNDFWFKIEVGYKNKIDKIDKYLQGK